MKLGPERRRALQDALESAGAERREGKGAGEEWRYALDGGVVTAWRPGTVAVAGKADARGRAEELVAAFGGDALGEPSSGTGPRGGYGEMPTDLPPDVAWAGVDESGKGDYFGPLVSAAVVVSPEAAAELAALGVQDSKKLTAKRVAALAPAVREAAAACAVTLLAPPAYNDEYARWRADGKRLNQMLAATHVRSICAALDEAGTEARPAYAIVDQFADARVVDEAAEGRCGGLRIVQFPRAEADVAVAAASIVAREAFVGWIDEASERVGMVLPKGAGPHVVAAARELVAEQGSEVLHDVAKLHFATTAQVLG